MCAPLGRKGGGAFPADVWGRTPNRAFLCSAANYQQGVKGIGCRAGYKHQRARTGNNRLKRDETQRNAQRARETAEGNTPGNTLNAGERLRKRWGNASAKSERRTARAGERFHPRFQALTCDSRARIGVFTGVFPAVRKRAGGQHPRVELKPLKPETGLQPTRGTPQGGCTSVSARP